MRSDGKKLQSLCSKSRHRFVLSIAIEPSIEIQIYSRPKNRYHSRLSNVQTSVIHQILRLTSNFSPALVPFEGNPTLLDPHSPVRQRSPQTSVRLRPVDKNGPVLQPTSNNSCSRSWIRFCACSILLRSDSISSFRNVGLDVDNVRSKGCRRSTSLSARDESS
jgi:hypothetical protein